MNKLTYELYKGSNEIIAIDLQNNYIIIAIKLWDKENHHYNVEFRLKEKTIDKWNLIGWADNVAFDAGYKTINSQILKWVAINHESGKFQEDIDFYKFETLAFDKLNELVESERFGIK